MRPKRQKTEKSKISGRKKGCKDNKILESFELKPTQNYTAKQLAQWWLLPGQSTKQVLNAIKLGKLPASKIGRSYIISGSDAIKYQKEMRVFKNK